MYKKNVGGGDDELIVSYTTKILKKYKLCATKEMSKPFSSIKFSCFVIIMYVIIQQMISGIDYINPKYLNV